MLTAFISHFKYFFLFQRYFTICLCSRADEKGMMQTLKFKIFPGLILFLDHRDPFFAACLFVPFSHLCRLQSWKKSTSITDTPPSPPRQTSRISSNAAYLLAATAGGTGGCPQGHRQHRSVRRPGGRADPCQSFVMPQSKFQMKSRRE